jgi:hypothetical protein
MAFVGHNACEDKVDELREEEDLLANDLSGIGRGGYGQGREGKLTQFRARLVVLSVG